MGSRSAAIDLEIGEENDPITSEGHRIIFQKEIPFELRIQEVGSEPQEVGTLESITVKLAVAVRAISDGAR